MLSSPLTVFAENAVDNTEMIVGGSLFGVRMYTEGVLVVGLDKVIGENGEQKTAPAYDAGIRMKDIIIEIDGKKVTDSESVTSSISGSNGKSLKVTVKRGENEKEFTLTPIKDKQGHYRAGVWIRDTAAGIGTVTYVDPKTGEFAGLGHGICDGDTGVLLPIKRGAVSGVELVGIVRGKKGIPGEIKGSFFGGKNGALLKNTECGVYGIFTEIPSELNIKLKTANKNEVKEGEAYIRCAVSGEIKQYTVNISKIDRSGGNVKNFVVTITDNELLELTGGIVQGMSGSPIIQNGKLIGAVTHVMINEPTTGYGIFIENMLDQAYVPAA